MNFSDIDQQIIISFTFESVEISIVNKFQDKQTEDEKTSRDTIGTGDKIDLKNIRAEDIRGRIIFKINEVPENQRIVMSTTSKNDRAQRARERLRRKFEEGQNVSPTNTRSRGRNN